MEPDQLAAAVASADRRALARAITLVESTRPDHADRAARLLGALPAERQALRIGLSGTPGVGKSTFIESFGMMLIRRGLRVAVLAVDPSSARSGGSILGDKTRMDRLARAPGAFIRPSPSQNTLGGVALRSRDVVRLCEGAGFDVVVIETVGVGQSETLVAQMSDVFVLLLAPAGGDELQGVKRGIMEIADLIVVNKADGGLKAAATRTCADYAGALRLLRKRPQDPDGYPSAHMVSAIEETGLDTVWSRIEGLARWRRDTGWLARGRAEQARFWLVDGIRRALLAQIETPQMRRRISELADAVAAGDLPERDAHARILAQLRKA